MNKLLAKMDWAKMSKNFLAIRLSRSAARSSMGCRTSVLTITMYREAYHLTNVQMGVFGSVLGVFGMIYLFGVGRR